MDYYVGSQSVLFVNLNNAIHNTRRTLDVYMYMNVPVLKTNCQLSYVFGPDLKCTSSGMPSFDNLNLKVQRISRLCRTEIP